MREKAQPRHRQESGECPTREKIPKAGRVGPGMARFWTRLDSQTNCTAGAIYYFSLDTRLYFKICSCLPFIYAICVL